MVGLPRRLFISLCGLLGMTERAAHRLGTRFFLPQLFLLRYCNMGGLDPEVFSGQLDGIRSFEDAAWCGHWNAIARGHEALADRALDDGAGLGDEAVRHALVKAMTYDVVGAFPGGSAARMEAYGSARRLFDRLAPVLDERLEKVELDVEGERVSGYVSFPSGTEPRPLVIVTNGLEGTVQELVLPLVGRRDAGQGLFVMEMPGTYAYSTPMSGASERIYGAVIERLAAHSRVDPKRIAIVGVSFGAYWSARLAAVNPGVACAVSCGPLLHHSFGLRGSIGLPEIIVSACKDVTGSASLLQLMRNLGKLSFEANDLYRRIRVPLLVLNGDSDTLASPKDTLELAAKAPGATLKLYEADDHCAMRHYDEWIADTAEWLLAQLG